MRAMILAAGRGERMRPLTDHTPKPLLEVAGKPLIVWHINRLVKAGITEIIINHAWLGEQIEQTLKNGKQFGANISYSSESKALETAGGIAKALPFFNNLPFLVVNADVWCDWNAERAIHFADKITSENKLAWLLMTKNPAHNPDGDFLFPTLNASNKLTFTGIGVYSPVMFDKIPKNQAVPLAPLLRNASKKDLLIASLHEGTWFDIGTPERLQQLNQSLVA